MGYTPRLTRPTSGNKYYITKAKGGYSSAITGKVKSTGAADAQCNVLANCVGYAVGRFNEIGGYGSCKYLSPVNAENFPEYAKGLSIGTEPKLGAVIVWQKGATLKGSDGAGHVAIVEQLNSDGSIVISQSGYNSTPFWTETLKKGDGNWRSSWMGSTYKFRCFIYNPAVSDADNVVTYVTLKRGCSGDNVKTLQNNLRTLGYTLTADGSYGPTTENIIKDFQTKNSLTVTGTVDKNTEAAIIAAVKHVKERPAGVNDLNLLVNNTTKTAWAIQVSGENYIRLKDLVTIGVAKSIDYNTVKKMPEVKL